jgi:hypothetical protein
MSGDHFRDLPLETPAKYTNANRETASSKFIHSGKRTPNIEMMQTAKSNIFAPFDEDIRFSTVLSKYKGKSDNHFPVELINP